MPAISPTAPECEPASICGVQTASASAVSAVRNATARTRYGPRRCWWICTTVTRSMRRSSRRTDCAGRCGAGVAGAAPRHGPVGVAEVARGSASRCGAGSLLRADRRVAAVELICVLHRPPPLSCRPRPVDPAESSLLLHIVGNESQCRAPPRAAPPEVRPGRHMPRHAANDVHPREVAKHGDSKPDGPSAGPRRHRWRTAACGVGAGPRVADQHARWAGRYRCPYKQ